MEKPTSVVLCGLPGVGKSSISNMLIQGDIYRDRENAYEINDAAGVTEELKDFSNDKFKVVDTSGLDTRGAINNVRNYFSKNKFPLNYICYVKNSKITKWDVECFETFKRIFKDGETNFIIIVTQTGPEWVNDQENVKSIKETFGDYPIISVDFPFNEDERYVEIDKKIREGSLQHLLEKLSELKNYKGIKLEVLSSSENFENQLSPIINFVPVVGSLYQLTASGVYYHSGKKDIAKKRLEAGASGLVLDVVAGATLGVSKPAAGVAVNLVGRAVMKYIGE